jgi:hypothetical protein
MKVEGPAVTRISYTLRRNEEKLSRTKNHLTYMLRCRKNDIILKGLCLNFPVRSHAANRIKQRAEHALLNERIRNTVGTKRYLTTNSQKTREEIREQVDEEGYKVIMELQGRQLQQEDF